MIHEQAAIMFLAAFWVSVLMVVCYLYGLKDGLGGMIGKVGLLRAWKLHRYSGYHEDGLTTTHIIEFLTDDRFKRAYQAGIDTGSWHGSHLRYRVYICCWAAEHALSLPGDFVECGVNRGGISRSVVEYVNFGSVDKRFYLLDTFCGDHAVAKANQRDYSDCLADVQKTFRRFNNVVLVPGHIPETLSGVQSKSISYLSIDLNNAEPEIAVLRFFWPKLVPGGIVILDDYAYSEEYRSQRVAMDKLGQELGFGILTLPTGQGLIIKI